MTTNDNDSRGYKGRTSSLSLAISLDNRLSHPQTLCHALQTWFLQAKTQVNDPHDGLAIY